MKSILKQIITEFQRNPIPKPIPRKITAFDHSLRKAWVYIGMRRSGKTWSMYQLMHELMDQGIDQTQLLYLNFEDDRLANMTIENFQDVLDAYWELHPQHTNSDTIYFFFDEIAEVHGWERFIRRLLDKEKMQIILTGSSAKLLSKEIATSLRGRTLTREIFPFSFTEYCQTQSIISATPPTSKEVATMQHYLNHYLKQGGFPEIIPAPKALHQEVLQGYIDSVIYHDIIERYEVKNYTVLRQLLLYCLQNPATLMSINKVFQQFKSRGLKISREALYQFMEYFEDAYCIFSIPVYSFSLNKAALKPKKIYPIDTGLINAYSIKPGYNEAACLETCVFTHLRRQHQELYYFQTQQAKEVDFLSLAPNGEIQLYQVSLTLADEKTRQRELSALIQGMNELTLQSATIITLDETDTLTLDDKQINIMPLWQFLS